MTRSALLIGMITLMACDLSEAADTDSYAQKLPDARVRIDMPAPAGAARSAEGDVSAFAGFTYDVTTDVNGLIDVVLTTVDTVTDFEPTWTDDAQTALWGPWEDDGLHYALWVRHDVEEGIYRWGLNLKGVDEGEDAFVTVVAGQTEDGATDDAYTGWFAIDFDSIVLKNPSETTRGRFISSYAVDGDAVVASAGFEDFADGADEPVDALYHYEQAIGADGLMDVVFLSDATGNGEDEMHIVRSRWSAAGEGRADAYLTGGELGALTYTATECWGDDFLVDYYIDNYHLVENGEASACAFEEPSFNEEDPEDSTAR
ncbi:MAG: hypothetical protein AAFV53_03455 [Myxococcota bacterium]